MYFLTWIGLPEIAVMPLPILVLLLVGASIVWLVIYDIRNYQKVFGQNKIPEAPTKEDSESPRKDGSNNP